MGESKDSYVDLMERIDGMVFREMDNDIMVDLLHHDEEYAAMRKQITDMQEAYPFIAAVMERESEISLTAEEHRILLEYLDVYRHMEDIERKQIYFRGHTDCFAYLKRIGVI